MPGAPAQRIALHSFIIVTDLRGIQGPERRFGGRNGRAVRLAGRP
jgi:hypothetical protein